MERKRILPYIKLVSTTQNTMNS
uniref:Uncharacterized protein n=1 Tax=Arundo donax TaxID=35708 RepID=A0A0A9H3X0_ARUDO